MAAGKAAGREVVAGESSQRGQPCSCSLRCKRKGIRADVTVLRSCLTGAAGCDSSSNRTSPCPNLLNLFRGQERSSLRSRVAYSSY